MLLSVVGRINKITKTTKKYKLSTPLDIKNMIIIIIKKLKH